MNNRLLIIATVALAFIVPPVVLLVTRRIEVFTATMTVSLLVLYLVGWQAMRAAVRSYYEKELSYTWIDPPLAYSDLPRGYHEELEGLGYHPAGFLQRKGLADMQTAVYVHRELPIYVLVGLERSGDSWATAVLQFDTFYPDGSRLSTTTSKTFAHLSAGVKGETTRLVQLRETGSPTALDGQHVGTVRAWLAGKRDPIPANPDRLIEYLEQDRRRLRDTLRSSGWVPFPAFLQTVLGRRPGILRF